MAPPFNIKTSSTPESCNSNIWPAARFVKCYDGLTNACYVFLKPQVSSFFYFWFRPFDGLSQMTKKRRKASQLSKITSGIWPLKMTSSVRMLPVAMTLLTKRSPHTLPTKRRRSAEQHVRLVTMWLRLLMCCHPSLYISPALSLSEQYAGLCEVPLHSTSAAAHSLIQLLLGGRGWSRWRRRRSSRWWWWRRRRVGTLRWHLYWADRVFRLELCAPLV